MTRRWRELFVDGVRFFYLPPLDFFSFAATASCPTNLSAASATCVLILLYICLHTTMYCVLILLYMCSHGLVSNTHARTVSAALQTDEPSVSIQTFAQMTSRLSAKRRSV